MAKAKTRFVIDVDGVDRQLFSVRERGHGDLVLLINGPSVNAFSPEDRETVIERHISVHRSPSSPTFTMNHTLITDGRGKTSRVASVLPSESGLVWPLIGNLAFPMRDPRFVLRARNGDRVVRLGKYNPTGNTLLYFIIVADPTGAARFVPFKNSMRSARADFEHFTIFVLWAYIGMSGEVGHYVAMQSSEPTLNGQRPSYRRVLASLEPGEIGPAVKEITRQLAVRLVEWAFDDAKRGGRGFGFITELEYILTALMISNYSTKELEEADDEIRSFFTFILPEKDLADRFTPRFVGEPFGKGWRVPGGGPLGHVLSSRRGQSSP